LPASLCGMRQEDGPKEGLLLAPCPGKMLSAVGGGSAW